MGKFPVLTATLLSLCAVAQAPAGTWYVDASVSKPGDGTSWETAFIAIQEGIDAASDGDTIIVAMGTYYENIHSDGKNITLRSTDPLDPDVVANTIIDGNQSGCVVTFAGTEDETCVLAGFSIRNGHADYGGGICGGTRTAHTGATISNNVVSGNMADLYGGGLCWCNGAIWGNTVTTNTGGGAYGCDGIIRDNDITENSGWRGAGLCECGALVEGNRILNNSAADDGGGLYDCDGKIHSNVIAGNSSEGNGGGLAFCQTVIEGNTISQNSADGDGGGLYCCDCTIRNNRITENSARLSGGGLAQCDGAIQENVILANRSRSILGGGGLADCDGLLEKNLISGNQALEGGALYDCDGTIHSNIITYNEEAGLYECDGTIQNNVISGNEGGKGSAGLAFCDGTILSCTITGNYGYGGGFYDCHGRISNCVIWGNTGYTGGQLYLSSVPTYCWIQDWTGGGEGNIAEDPRFVDPDGPDDDPRTCEDNDFHLLPNSPCIDAGTNDLVNLPETDIVGNPRILYGGKSFTVDMGAYEYRINRLKWGPGMREATLTWSSLPDGIYLILYSDDLLSWQLAGDYVPSAGNETTSWADDGSKTGVLPSVVPRRFYRILESP